MTRPALDNWLRRLTSRKLLVLIAGTVLLCVGRLDSGQWLWLAAAYMGANALRAFAGGHSD